MATKYHNLSQYDGTTLPTAEFLSNKAVAIVVADWNSNITHALLDGAVETLEKHGVGKTDVYHVPGTFELTYGASLLGKSGRYSAIIVIGCVIKGDTPHFDYICQGVTTGITKLNAEGSCPVIFSVLTTLDMQQAIDRSGGKLGNKGIEGAVTALTMIGLTNSIK